MDSDLAIARRAALHPIEAIAETLGVPSDALIPYGRDKAKVRPLGRSQKGKLVLVTAINPTPAGEGKTTTTIGLADGLNHIGHQAVACLREPSLGPCFGMKGGATGGGHAQVVPMEDINLHFTGDFHAIGAANNLLSALLDNSLHFGNPLGLHPDRINVRRVLDMNDRVLREVVLGLGGAANGATRQSGFDITVASEVMAILCLSEGADALKARLGDIVVGETRERRFVRAHELSAAGAMAVLLKDAMLPNLVQTLEGTPAFIHGGPFANIAHGCNSVAATRTALSLSDYVVTEAGFGADLGAEKFFDIKCRLAGLTPSAAVIVATLRALKMHGGVAKNALGQSDPEAVRRGAANLRRHVENVARFGVPAIVAVNRFTADTEDEIAALRESLSDLSIEVIVCDHWARGGAGAAELAEKVVELANAGGAFAPLYDDALGLWDKIETIATKIYRAASVVPAVGIRETLARWEEAGFGHLPICMAKTPASFSADPSLLGAPEGFEVPIRDVRLSAGAGFVVALTGTVMTMPGLPRQPAAAHIDLVDGVIEGLS